MNPETLKAAPNNPVEEAYSRLHFSPDADIYEMNLNSVLRVVIPEDVPGISDNGVDYLAFLAVPSEQGRDTVLGIFKGSDGQTYISSGEDGVEPFLFNKGTKLTLGRDGMYVESLGGNGRVLKSRVDSNHVPSIIDGFGSQTSGEHLIIYLDQSGNLDISDHSTNGTKIIAPKSDKITKFVNALESTVSSPSI